MSFKIVIDSTTDLPQGLADKWGLTVIPYIYNLDGKEYYNYLDYRQLSVKDFYGALRGGKTATTTQVTTFRYLEAWEPILKEGNDVLYMCLSSALSKSYDQSVLAAREAAETYPDRKIITIDSKAASLGQGLLAFYAAKARDEGKTLEETAAYIESLIPRVNLWIMADDLNHLRRGGRVSGASAFVGTMLSIKPILTILDDGKLVPISKVRGRGKALDYMVERMKEGMNPKDQTVFIAHSDVPEFAEQAKNMFAEKLGVENFIVNEIGPVIGAHTGPGTLAAIFLANDRPKV